ncbi:MAG: hypothetical protein DYG89_50275 [Caldilinea sp. CFX5]|nr:hypothetical protein [Caldilinea sp. CFX5]
MRFVTALAPWEPCGYKPHLRLLAFNEATGATGYYTVTAVMVHIDPTIVHLTIDGETIETTPEHPFYVMESAPWLATGETQGRWVDAGELHVGDAVRQADGTTGIVQGVVVVQRSQPMYNLTVAVAHTFFVGEQQWLVHNVKCYRVEGVPNQRLNLDAAGNVTLVPKKQGMLHLSFGGPGHAEHFLGLKVKGRLPNAHVKEFEVSDDFLDLIRKDAVLQDGAPPGLPQIDDPHIANPLGSEAYGIPATYFEIFIDSILPGSGSIWK